MPFCRPPSACLLHIFLTLPFVISFLLDSVTTEIYPLSLHDALPISCRATSRSTRSTSRGCGSCCPCCPPSRSRSEEHTSELQSLTKLVCRLLLEKKKHDQL